MALSFSSNRITGDQGRGTFVSLGTTGLLTATEDSANNFSDSGDTNFAGMQYKRLLLVVDGTNSRWVGWGYVSARLADSGSNQRFQMDEIRDRNGDVAYFIDFQGNPVTPTTSDDVILSSCLQDLDLSSSENTIQESEGQTKYTLSGTPASTHTGTAHFGSATHGDQVGLVMHNEFTTVDTGAHLTNARHSRFGLEGGFTSWMRILDYQNNVTTGKCNIIHPTTATRDIFAYGTTVNSATQKGTAIVFSGTILADGGGRFPGNTGIQSPQVVANVSIGACLFMDVQTNCDIISGEDGTALPTSGIAGDWGGADNNIIRKVESKQFALNGINVRFWGTVEESSFTSFNAGATGTLSGTGSDSGSTAAAPYVFGNAGTAYTEMPLFRDSSYPNFPFFWRSNSGSTNSYVTVLNTNSTDRTARKGSGTFDATSDFHGGWRCRWAYEGTWTGLDSDSEIFATYDNSSAGTLGESFFANEWDNFKPTVNSDGTANVQFTHAIYAGKTDGRWDTRTDNGYREIDPDNVDSDNRGLSEVQTGWEYTVKAYGYHCLYVDVSEVDKGVSGTEVKSLEIGGSTTAGGSLSGGWDADNGNYQTADANITNGLDIEGNAFTKAHVTSLMGTVADGAYPNLTKSADTGDITYTFNDAGLVGISNNLDHISLDEMYAMFHYLYAVPATDTEGYKHLVMPFHSVGDDGRWTVTTIDNDSDATAFIFRTDSDDSTNKVSALNSTIKGITFDGSKSAIDLNDFVLGNGLLLTSDNPDDDSASFVQLGATDQIWSDYNSASKAITDITLRGRVDANITSGTTVDIYFDPDSTHNIWHNSSTKFQLRNIGAGTINVYGLTPDSNGIRDNVDASFYSSGTGSINFRKEITAKFVVGAFDYNPTKDAIQVSAWSKGTGSFTEITVADADITLAPGDDTNSFEIKFDFPADEELYYAVHYRAEEDGEASYLPVVAREITSNPAEVEFEAIAENALSYSQNDAGSIDDADVTVTALTSNTSDIVVSIDTIQGSPAADIADLSNDEARWFFANILVRDSEVLAAIAKDYLPDNPWTYSASYVFMDDALKSTDNSWRLQMNGDADRSFLLLDAVVVDSAERSLQYDLTDRSGTNANRIVVVALSTNGMSYSQWEAGMDERYLTSKSVTNIGLRLPVVDSNGYRKTPSSSE